MFKAEHRIGPNVNDLVTIDLDLLMSKVRAKIGPTDLDPALLDASVRLGMAVALEILLPGVPASRRQAIETAILHHLRDAVEVAFPVLGNEFVRSLESEMKEFASDIVGMTHIVGRHQGDPIDEQGAEELIEILRELDNTRLWRTVICAGAPSGSLINQACEILRDCCLRALDETGRPGWIVGWREDALAV